MNQIGIKSRAWAILNYLNILILIPLIWKQDDQFVRFHSKQGIVLMFIGIILEIIEGIVAQIEAWAFGRIVVSVLGIYIIIGITNCIRGRRTPLPLIGRIAEKITL